MITLLLILSLHAQTFIPKFGGGGTPPAANGLLNNLVWYVEADQASGNEPPDSPTGCCSGNDFQEVGGSWGSTTGVITNSRTAGAATSLYLNYDYAGGSSFTITGWFNLASVGTTQVLLASWDVGVGFEEAQEFRLRYITGTGAIELTVAHAGSPPLSATTVSMVPSPAITTGNWFFVVGGFDDTGNILFLASEERASTLPSLTTTAFVGAMQGINVGAAIGTQSDGGVPDLVNNVISSGSAMDAWNYWNRVLDGTQIGLLYAETPYGSFTF